MYSNLSDFFQVDPWTTGQPWNVELLSLPSKLIMLTLSRKLSVSWICVTWDRNEAKDLLRSLYSRSVYLTVEKSLVENKAPNSRAPPKKKPLTKKQKAFRKVKIPKHMSGVLSWISNIFKVRTGQLAQKPPRFNL